MQTFDILVKAQMQTFDIFAKAQLKAFDFSIDKTY